MVLLPRQQAYTGNSKLIWPTRFHYYSIALGQQAQGHYGKLIDVFLQVSNSGLGSVNTCQALKVVCLAMRARLVTHVPVLLDENTSETSCIARRALIRKPCNNLASTLVRNNSRKAGATAGWAGPSPSYAIQFCRFRVVQGLFQLYQPWIYRTVMHASRYL